MRKPEDFDFASNGFKSTTKRYFSTITVKPSEMLLLSTEDIDHMKRDYPLSSTNYFQQMMQQTVEILNEHCITQ